MCGASILCEIPCKAWEKTGRKTDSPYRPTLERTEQMIEVMLDLCVAGEAPGALRVHGTAGVPITVWNGGSVIPLRPTCYIGVSGQRSKERRGNMCLEKEQYVQSPEMTKRGLPLREWRKFVGAEVKE